MSENVNETVEVEAPARVLLMRPPQCGADARSARATW